MLPPEFNLSATLGRLCPDSAELQACVAGDPLTASAEWLALPELSAVCCRVSPAGYGEVHLIYVPLYLSGLPRPLRAIIGGEAFLVTSVQFDGSRRSTRLIARRYRVVSEPRVVLLDTVALDSASALAPGLWAGVACGSFPLWLTSAEDYRIGGSEMGLALPQAAVLGTLETPYTPAVDATTRFDYGTTLTVQLEGRAPGSITPAAARAGGNLLALGELLTVAAQWQPLGEDRYSISGLLPGRRGSDYVTAVPAGAPVLVLTDEAGSPHPGVRRVPVPAARLGRPLTFYLTQSEGAVLPWTINAMCHGHSLRPLPPVRPRLLRARDGAVTLRWEARTRLDDYFWSQGLRPAASDLWQCAVTLLSESGVALQRRIVTTTGGGFSLSWTAAELTAIYGAVPGLLRGEICHAGGWPRVFCG